MDLNNELLNMVFNKKDTKRSEDKTENELDLNDRLYLVSKNLDNQLKNNLYENLIENKNLLFSQDDCIINDYV